MCVIRVTLTNIMHIIQVSRLHGTGLKKVHPSTATSRRRSDITRLNGSMWYDPPVAIAVSRLLESQYLGTGDCRQLSKTAIF